MKLILLGTGGPFPDPSRHGAAAALQVGDEYLLFDAGRGVVLQLVRAGIPLDRIRHLFLTHHHYDHIGDLADVILTTWLAGRRETLKMFGPPGTRSIVAALMEGVYGRDIEFRSTGALATQWTPVESADVVRGPVESGHGWKVSAETVVHGHGLGFTPAFTARWVCLGYRVEAEGGVVAVSGDTVECEGLDRLARQADLLLQCCYLAEAEITTPTLARLAKETIACADSVGKIARRAAARKLVLTHFRRKPATMMETLAAEVARDYDGPVVLGADLAEIAVKRVAGSGRHAPCSRS